LLQLELYMKMYRDIRGGRLRFLVSDLKEWRERAGELSERYSSNYAFGKARWAGANGVYANYVDRFLSEPYSEADRIHRSEVILTDPPICQARYRADPELKLPTSGPPQELADTDARTDFCVQTWSGLGRHDYFGTMSYQTTFKVPSAPGGKRAFVWLSNVDGVTQVWVNGIPARPMTGSSETSSEVHLKGTTFEIVGRLHENATNTMNVAVQRTRLAELGSGGLLGPVYVYRNH
jgi:hypothetical protein